MTSHALSGIPAEIPSPHTESWAGTARTKRWAFVLLAVAVMTAMLPAATPASGVAAPAPGDSLPGSLIVTMQEDADASLQQAVDGLPDDLGVGPVQQLAGRISRIRTTPEDRDHVADLLRSQPDVEAVEPDRLLEHHRIPGDTYFPKQWAHQRTGAPEAWDTTTGSDQVLVAVIDTGMRGDHPDLRDNVAGQVDVSTGSPAGPERVGIDNDTCDLGHGTWVGGVVGAVGDNGTGIAGAAWQVRLLDISTNSTRAGATCDGIPMSAVIAGIDYAVADRVEPADVVNISLGGYLDRCPTGLQAAVDDARAQGAVIVASAGNGEQDSATAGRTAYPAGCEGVIGVGATDRQDDRAAYSQINATVDVVAPGGDYDAGGADGLVVTTSDTYTTSALTLVQGTSFAAPYVAGVAALLRSVQPLSGPTEVERVLSETAADLGPDGRDDAYGHGLVQADEAVEAAVTALPEAPQPDDPLSPSPSPSPSPSEEAEQPAPDTSVQRIAAGSPSRPIPTAVAISREVFPADGAAHVVLARSDVFADALAGSTLAAGAGPLLFTRSSGTLSDATRQEIRRVLPDGGAVYLLGGTQALPASTGEELRELGYRPRRVAGPTREDTAVAVATEARRRIPELGGTNPRAVVLATRSNWPDAVTAGSLGSTFGMPILLTSRDGLHPATRRFLERTSPQTIYVAGGAAAISRTTASAAATAADGNAVRLAGPTRLGTATDIARAYDRLHDADSDTAPRFAIAVNLYREDAWAYTLAASALVGLSGGVFVPARGADGNALSSQATDFLRSRRNDSRVLGAIPGAEDLVADHTGRQLADLLTDDS